MKPTAVDKAKVTLLVDNYYDVLLPSTEHVVRVGPGQTKKPLMAGHGFSIFVEVWKNGEYENILVDASHSHVVLLNNLEGLNIDPDTINAAFISHGHFDHYQGLAGLAERRTKPLTTYIHPDAFYPKLLVTPKGKIGPWVFDKELHEEKGIRFVEERIPCVVNKFFILSGEIERTTDFEKPWPAAKILKNEKETQDYFIDEQALGILVKDKGLIVIAGCSHPGIVNIVRHMHNITQEKILCIVGGFHLSILPEEIIKKTINALLEFEPKLIMPCHCTGFEPTVMMYEMCKDRFAVNCVGTSIVFSSNNA